MKTPGPAASMFRSPVVWSITDTCSKGKDKKKKKKRRGQILHFALPTTKKDTRHLVASSDAGGRVGHTWE